MEMTINATNIETAESMKAWAENHAAARVTSERCYRDMELVVEMLGQVTEVERVAQAGATLIALYARARDLEARGF